MPKFYDESRAFDGEVARLAARSAPYFRPVRTKSRPSWGHRSYYGTPVPGYTPTTFCKVDGVVDTRIPITNVRHRFFVCRYRGNDYLFNTNDSNEGPVPQDGSHVSKFVGYDRPMMKRTNQITLSFNAVEGECNEFSVNLSQFWHHPRHEALSEKDRDRLWSHMVSCCVGASSTRDWHEMLWNFSFELQYP
jgi:hypothetical protein